MPEVEIKTKITRSTLKKAKKIVMMPVTYDFGCFISLTIFGENKQIIAKDSCLSKEELSRLDFTQICD